MTDTTPAPLMTVDEINELTGDDAADRSLSGKARRRARKADQ